MTDSSAPSQAVEALTPLQQALISRADSLFASLSQTVSKASDIASQQLPDIATQYLAYGRVINTLWVVLPLLFIGLGAWLLLKVAILNKYELEDDRLNDAHTGRYAAGVVGGIMMAVSLITLFVNLPDFIKVWVSPKVWLLQQIVELAHSLHRP